MTKPAVAVFEAKCGMGHKNRRRLRVKNHLIVEEFTADKPILEQGKTYKITIEEVEDDS